jgi:hypothetical protein
MVCGGWIQTAAKLLTKDEGARIAANIAKLPSALEPYETSNGGWDSRCQGFLARQMNSRCCQGRNPRFLSILKTLTISLSFVGHPKNADVQSISHEKHHARDTFRRISVNFCKPVLILDGPTTRRSPIDCPCARRWTHRRRSRRATIATEGELKATIRTFQGDNPSAVYRYYWWRDSCYVRFQSDNYKLVTSDYCHH